MKPENNLQRLLKQLCECGFVVVDGKRVYVSAPSLN